MAADISAVGDRGLHSVGSGTESRARGHGNKRGPLKTLAIVALGLIVVVAAVACFAISPSTPRIARSSSTPWIFYTIDSNQGRWPSVAIDSHDNVHISYQSPSGWTYATNVGGSWVISGIDNLSVGRSSLALDSNDSAHISSGGPLGLQYVTNAGGSWVPTTVDTVDTNMASLALDSEDKVHISYQGRNGYYWKDLRYATNANGSWETYTIAAHGSYYTGDSNSLAVDSSDRVHISYYDYDRWGFGHDLIYASFVNHPSAGYGIIDVYVPVGLGYESSSIAIDSNDKVHICFNNWALSYATNANGSWEFSSIDTPSDPRNYGFNAISLALDSNNKAHISYFDDSWPFFLKYATNVNGTWEDFTIDNIYVFGSSLALDSAGNVHIVYGTQTGIKYATNAEPIIVPEFEPAGLVVIVIVTVSIFIALWRTSFPSSKK